MNPVLIERIRATFAGKTKVFASELGNAVRRAAAETNEPPPDIQAYGGIRKFVRDFFATELSEDPASFGVNLAFTVSELSKSSTPLVQSLAMLSGNGKRLWTALTNPRHDGKVGWHPTKRELIWVTANEEFPAEAFQIPPIGYDDYAKLAEEFVDKYSPPLPAGANREITAAIELRDPAMGDRLFSVFTKFKMLRQWERFRREQALKMILDRAERIDVSAADAVKSLLAESRADRPNRKPVVSKPRHLNSQLDLQEVITKALPFLSADQLRAVALPIGAVVDAIASIRQDHLKDGDR